MTGDRSDRKPSLLGRALKLLARREYTRAEISRRLAADAEDPAEIGKVLDECERRGWLSERRVVEQRVHTLRRRYGALRIERDLAAKGISADALAAAMTELKGGELDAARDVWRRKFGGRLPRNAAERGRQARFLQGRGFGMDVILKIIKGGDES